MPFALWSILLAALLPLVWAIIAKVGAPYDNHRPREILSQAQGYRQRANWAQQNAWEAFAPYAVAMLLAWHLKVPTSRLDVAALVFIVARVAHGIFYLRNTAGVRSIVWLLGMLVVVYLFFAAAWA